MVNLLRNGRTYWSTHNKDWDIKEPCEVKVSCTVLKERVSYKGSHRKGSLDSNKLIPNKGQSHRMDNWVNMLRAHYNWCLRDRLDQYLMHHTEGAYCDLRTRVELTPVSCCVSKNGATGDPWVASKPKLRSAGDIQITALPQLKKQRPWYAEIDATALQQNVKRLDIAYKNFFEGRGFPSFKNRSNFTSFSVVMGVKVQENRIYLPKLGWMRLHLSRCIPGGFVIKAATIRKRQDGWYVSLRIEDKTVPELSPKPLAEVQKVLGCDMGLTKLVHLSDGYQVENPRYATNKKTKKLLKVRQRRVSRKQKGSKNRKKASQKLGRFHKKIADKRDAHQWQTAHNIVSRKVDAIAVEDLNVSGLMRRCKPQKCESTGRFLKNGQSRKKGLNRSIADASWSNLILKIEYLAVKQGKVCIKVNPRHSSQDCRACGHKDKANRDRERFICTQCSHIEHADIGAAKTVRDRAIELAKVPGDSRKLEGKTSKRPKKSKEISPRSQSKRGEPGNMNNKKSRKVVHDIEASA